LRGNCVQPSTATEALQFLCGYFKRTFPKISKKKHEIIQFIEIPLEARKRNSFNYLSKRSRELIELFRTIQKIRKYHLALFPVSDDIVRFMFEKMLKLITMYFFLSVAQQSNTVSAVLFLGFLLVGQTQ